MQYRCKLLYLDWLVNSGQVSWTMTFQWHWETMCVLATSSLPSLCSQGKTLPYAGKIQRMSLHLMLTAENPLKERYSSKHPRTHSHEFQQAGIFGNSFQIHQDLGLMIRTCISADRGHYPFHLDWPENDSNEFNMGLRSPKQLQRCEDLKRRKYWKRNQARRLVQKNSYFRCSRALAHVRLVDISCC